MSAALIADRPDSQLRGIGADVDFDRLESEYLAPVVPIRRSLRVAEQQEPVSPVEPLRPIRRTARPVSRRAGSRGARYASAPVSDGWRLTRRGELAVRWVTVVATAAVVGLVLTAATFAVVGAVTSSAPVTRTVSVESGQTLWSIAATADPHGDVRDTVDEIRSLNHLAGTTVTPGQTLLVPATG